MGKVIMITLLVDHLPIMSTFGWRGAKVIIVSRRATGV
jgi:hypothetical protein